MSPTRVKRHLEFITNIAVVLVVVAAVGVAVKQYFGSKAPGESKNRIQVGTVFPTFSNVSYSQSPKTLILALSVSCRFCISSVPFYQSLAQAHRENNNSFQIVALFLDKERDLVNRFVEQKSLPVTAVSSVDFSSLQIPLTPTVILVDSAGKVLNSWVGRLSEDEEKDVFYALGVPYKPAAPSASLATSIVEPEKTTDVFDENKPLLTIEPQTSADDAQKRFVNVFDVDSKGNIYLIDINSLLIYDPQGKLLSSNLLPRDFRLPFCVDDKGQIYAQSNSGLSVYSSSLAKIRDVSLDGVVSKNSIVLKLALDRKRGELYVQVYDESPLSQRLYKVNLPTLQAKEIFHLEKPVPFNPTYTPGAFDFTLGSQYVYVSDIREYKVFLFSLSDGSLVKTFTRPFKPVPIQKEDGRLPIRKVTIGGLGETLQEYPPIFHLNFTNKGRLLVWTGNRNRDNRQVVDVYDQQMNFLGVDLKYMHPGRNNYLFVSDKVYAPDFGSGKEFQAGSLSPLEVPSRPIALKVFAE